MPRVHFNTIIPTKIVCCGIEGQTFHWTEVLACEFSSNQSFAHVGGTCRVQIKFEGFQHLELALVALVQLMWLKIT
jgi:hypothetical protein